MKNLRKSVHHYYRAMAFPPKQTEAMKEGSAFHDAIEDYEAFQDTYTVMPKFSGTGMKKKKEDWLAENNHKQFLSEDAYRMIIGMRESFLSHPYAQYYINGSIVEGSFFWEDPSTGIICKTRPDFLRKNLGIGIDLKSTLDARPDIFAKDIQKYDYHLQAAMCIDGINAVWGDDTWQMESFIFLLVEKAGDYQIATYELEQSAIDHGRECYKALLQRLADSQEHTGDWTGYPLEVQTIDLPKWGYTQL